MYLELGKVLKRTEMSWGKREAGRGDARKLEQGPRQGLATVLRAQPKGFQGKPVPLSSGILHRPGDKAATRVEEPQLAS